MPPRPRPEQSARRGASPQIRECVQQYAYIYVFSVEDMRNAYLKDVRTHWKDSRYVALAAAPSRDGIADPPRASFEAAVVAQLLPRVEPSHGRGPRQDRGVGAHAKPTPDQRRTPTPRAGSRVAAGPVLTLLSRASGACWPDQRLSGNVGLFMTNTKPAAVKKYDARHCRLLREKMGSSPCPLTGRRRRCTGGSTSTARRTLRARAPLLARPSSCPRVRALALQELGNARASPHPCAISCELSHAGPLMSHGEKVAHSLEPMFRKLGLPTILKNGPAGPPRWTTSNARPPKANPMDPAGVEPHLMRRRGHPDGAVHRVHRWPAALRRQRARAGTPAARRRRGALPVAILTALGHTPALHLTQKLLNLQLAEFHIRLLCYWHKNKFVELEPAAAPAAMATDD